MTNIIVKLSEDDVNLLRRLLINEIEMLESDKLKCSHDVEFEIIEKNLNSHIKHANNLCNIICKAYNERIE